MAAVSRKGFSLPSGAARLMLPVGLILVLLVVNFFTNRGFFSISWVNGGLSGSLIDIMNRAAPVLILGYGMTLVIATGGVDLSVGALVAIAGSMTAYLMTGKTALPVGVALMVSAAMTTILGAVNGYLVGFLKIQPMVATLVLMVSGRGVAQLLTEGQMVRLSDDALSYWSAGRFFGVPTAIYVALVVGLLVTLFVRGTALGLFLEATGESEKAAETAGVEVRWVKMVAYAVSGLCAGIAGLVIMSDTKVADANSAGLYLELDAILAVVLGGTLLTGGRFSLAGTVLGALVIQTLTTTIYSTGIKPEANLVVKAVTVLVACLLQSEKFRAKFRRRKGV
jgi:simple sugar transport system permease protein